MPSSAQSEPRLSSGGSSWNDEALGGDVASDPKCSPPRLSGTGAGRTGLQALALGPRFLLRILDVVDGVDVKRPEL
jgi:hypothetical protein